VTSSDDEFLNLVKAGRIAEARAMLEEQKLKLKFASDTIIQSPGKPIRFTRRGKPVEPDRAGGWKVKADE